MRIGVFADIGHPVWHAGDDLLAEGAYQKVIGAGHTPVLFTHSADLSRRLFPGAELVSAPTIGQTYTESSSLTQEALSALSAQHLDDIPIELSGTIEALRSLDALIIAGGGALVDAPYVWLVYERQFMVLAAHTLGIPVIVTGQSVGPYISHYHEQAFRDILDTSDLVGLRGRISAATASRLSHRSIYAGIDDGIAYAANRVSRGTDAIAVMLAHSPQAEGAFGRETVYRAYARLIDYICERTGLTVRFIPHMADPDAGNVDIDMHRRVAQHLRCPYTFIPLRSGIETVTGLADCALAITNRFHGAVFALANAIPALPIATDYYTHQRLVDMLEAFGLGPDWILPIDALIYQGDRELVDSWLDSEARISARATENIPRLIDHDIQWWDAVFAACSRQHPAVRNYEVPSALLNPPALSSPLDVFHHSLRDRGFMGAGCDYLTQLDHTIQASSLQTLFRGTLAAQTRRVTQLQNECRDVRSDLERLRSRRFVRAMGHLERVRDRSRHLIHETTRLVAYVRDPFAHR